jgi:Holliday junction resolvase RusA-like endonuclease
LTVPGRPVPWKAPDVVRRRRRDGSITRVGITPDTTKAWQAFVRIMANRARPCGLLWGALELRVDIHLRVPPSWPVWRRAAALEGLVRPTARPDSTNLLKALEDACNGVLWGDDAQVVDSHAHRWYCAGAELERAEVVVQEVGAGGDARPDDLARVKGWT